MHWQKRERKLTVLLPQKVDCLALRVELLCSFIDFSTHDSNPTTDWGRAWFMEYGTSPIDRWYSLPGRTLETSVSFFLCFCWPCCSINWMLDSLCDRESTGRFDFEAELKFFLGDPTSESSPPKAWMGKNTHTICRRQWGIWFKWVNSKNIEFQYFNK